MPGSMPTVKKKLMDDAGFESGSSAPQPLPHYHISGRIIMVLVLQTYQNNYCYGLGVAVAEWSKALLERDRIN